VNSLSNTTVLIIISPFAIIAGLTLLDYVRAADFIARITFFLILPMLFILKVVFS
jgi:hypothetical protein